ncbi:MAG: alpha,alpha-trehalose phosphorylase, partial [Solirubrobacteraceae bacterium]|nr:alpha,alpha-trehalose phosphorylase [Solirubrobacteraceae bacterium]
DIERGTVESHVRRLDLRDGILDRELVWCSAHGDRIRLRSRRLVSFVQRSVAAISFEVEALDRPLRIALQSAMAGDGTASTAHDDPRAGRELGDVLDPRLSTSNELRAVLGYTTKRSKMSVACGMDHVIDAPGDARVTTDAEEQLARVTVSARLAPGETLRLEKFLAYHWSSRQTVAWLRDQVDASLENALAEGWEGLVGVQKDYLDDWWSRAAMELEGDDEVALALHVALFHLLQSSCRIEGQPIAAKGLTGSGYDGHAFWDTEAFVLPHLTYVKPRVVRDALMWRHTILPHAREVAQQFGLAGAVFPWRTIGGQECSAYWPAGLAAVHVNADIADAVRRYVHVTGDQEFEAEYGVELLAETARLWISLGNYDYDGRFRIAGVTGPDEYSAVKDDNVFTNLMAKRNLLHAVAAVERHEAVAEALDIDREEVDAWKSAGAAMFVPYDTQRGVHPAHDGFLDLPRWDFEKTDPSHYPLLLHHPYFELYRQQVVKQADLVLAMWFAGDEFGADVKRRNFDYYEGVTVRDSSLSAAAQAVVAAEVGHLDLAWTYLREAALTDLRDLHANAASGLHMASLGGAVLAAVAGIGGFRDTTDELVFRPRLPESIERLCYRLTIRGSRLRVDVNQDEATYEVESGEPLEIVHFDERETVSDPVSLAIPEAPELERPTQPLHREPGTELDQ